MHTSDVTIRSRSGGVMWLAVLISIGCLWGSPLAIWPTLLISWTTCNIAFIIIRCNQRYISSSNCISSILLTAGAAIGAAFIGYGVNQCALKIEIGADYTIGYAILLSLLLAAGLFLMLLTSVLARSAAESGNRPSQIIIQAYRIVRSDTRVWPLGNLLSMMYMLAIVSAYPFGSAMQSVIGMLAAYAQARMLGELSRATIREDRADRTMNVRSKHHARKLNLIAIVALQLIVISFYVALGSIGGEAIRWSMLLDYPLAWISGIVIALIAWLIGLYRPIYILVIVSITILNLIMLGIIIGINRTNLFQ
jgi:hypothetical protein